MTDRGNDLVVHHDEERHKFVVELGGREAYLRYVRAGDRTLRYSRTFVPPEYRGRGIGALIVASALDYARERQFHVVPTCPFVQWVADHHPE
jgi:predicted GNAT family acetyltransferase